MSQTVPTVHSKPWDVRIIYILILLLKVVLPFPARALSFLFSHFFCVPRYELTLQNAQRVLASLLEQPAKPWVPFSVSWHSRSSAAVFPQQGLLRYGTNVIHSRCTYVSQSGPSSPG